MRTVNRSRRMLVWCCLLFLTGQGMWSTVAEYVPKLRDPSYGDKLTKLQRRTRAFPDRPLVLMLGSSRTGYALDGLSAEDRLYCAHAKRAIVFNFGVPAAGPVTHLLYLRRLLGAAVKPNLLLVEVMPALLHNDAGKALERSFFVPERFFGGEATFVADYGFDESAAGRARLHSLLLPADSLRFPASARIAPSWLPWQVRYDWSRGADACGWNRIQHPDVTEEQRARYTASARSEYGKTLGELDLEGPALRALGDLAALCRQHSIPVVFVLLPEGPAFRSWYSDTALLPLRHLSSTADIQLFDARACIEECGFADSHHLLPDGSASFTRSLIDAVVAEKLPPESSAK